MPRVLHRGSKAKLVYLCVVCVLLRDMVVTVVGNYYIVHTWLFPSHCEGGLQHHAFKTSKHPLCDHVCC